MYRSIYMCCKSVLACLILTGCETGPAFIQADPKMAPTCEQLRVAFRASLSDFDSVRSGLEVSKSDSIYRIFDTSLSMRNASSCVIRRYSVQDELYCRWEAGNNIDLMGAYYRAVRDQLKECIREGSVSQDDRMGSTSVDINSTKGNVRFWVVAKYQNPPYYVYLTVQPS